MQNYGKEKCRILKKIRAEIARQNDIEWVTEECKHKGNCRGTCPKCEAEVRQLEAELDRKRSLGKSIVVAGVAAGIAVNMAACNPDTSSAEQGNMVIDRTAQTVDNPEIPGGMMPEGVETLVEGELIAPDAHESYELMGDPIESEAQESYELMGDIIAPESGQ